MIAGCNGSSSTAVVSRKIVILGDGAVGKSSLIKRLCDGLFDDSYKQTVGLEFAKKELSLQIADSTSVDFSEATRDGNSTKGAGTVSEVRLQLWDVSGQQMEEAALAQYIYGSHAVCFVFDMTKMCTFKGISDWLRSMWVEFQRHGSARAKASGHAPILSLVGNKADLSGQEIGADVARAFAEQHNMKLYLVSAKTGEGVHEMFTDIVARMEDLCNVKYVAAEVTENVDKQDIKNFDCGEEVINLRLSVEKKFRKGCIMS